MSDVIKSGLIWIAVIVGVIGASFGLYYLIDSSDRNRAEEFIADCKAGGFSSYRIGRELVCVNSDDRVIAQIYD